MSSRAFRVRNVRRRREAAKRLGCGAINAVDGQRRTAATSRWKSMSVSLYECACSNERGQCGEITESACVGVRMSREKVRLEGWKFVEAVELRSGRFKGAHGSLLWHYGQSSHGWRGESSNASAVERWLGQLSAVSAVR